MLHWWFQPLMLHRWFSLVSCTLLPLFINHFRLPLPHSELDAVPVVSAIDAAQVIQPGKLHSPLSLST